MDCLKAGPTPVTKRPSSFIHVSALQHMLTALPSLALHQGTRLKCAGRMRGRSYQEACPACVPGYEAARMQVHTWHHILTVSALSCLSSDRVSEELLRLHWLEYIRNAPRARRMTLNLLIRCTSSEVHHYEQVAKSRLLKDDRRRCVQEDTEEM
jgi:hypothetical protein